MNGQHTMGEWKQMIAKEKIKDTAVKEKKSIKQQLAEAKVKADEINAARKKAATATPAGEQEQKHVINILDD
ncbi:hypothetical protein [uncultured Alistipes sp.]|uniref:hypothetical protein n=1 Tax=uncultured Alistipes sp. TaxID=538949 RepID=UPI0032205FA9